jgi:hypothetical protein
MEQLFVSNRDDKQAKTGLCNAIEVLYDARTVIYCMDKRSLARGRQLIMFTARNVEKTRKIRLNGLKEVVK